MASSSAGGRGIIAAADDGDTRRCDLFRCFCRWRRRCSPRVPRVAPGGDYACAPAGADGGRPLWSVLVGCTSARAPPSHDLRLHRFRVAGSGRVLGRSDDPLEPFRSVSPEDDSGGGGGESTTFPAAKAALAPDRRRLYIACVHQPSAGAGRAADARLPPKVFSMSTGDKSLAPLPPLPLPRGSFELVSAHGGLWAPAVVHERSSDARMVTWRLFVYRLVDGGGGGWAEASSVEFPYRHSMENNRYGGHLLQGYAVIGDRFILLSFVGSSFYCFDCAAGSLTRVAADGTRGTHQYIPISGRAVHVAGDGDAVYFVRDNRLLAYRYSPEERAPLAPPAEVGTLWPYDEEGYGSVVPLAGRMLCAVWVNMRRPCGCAARHALITTLTVRGAAGTRGCFVPNGVDVLYSTCRRIDMLGSEAPGRGSCLDTFCFLQEYPDRGEMFDPSISSVIRGVQAHQTEKFSEMPTCCREFLNGKPDRIPAFAGAMMLEDCTVATKSDFYFICQVDQRSLVYHISTSGGKFTGCHEKPLEALLCLDTARPGEVDDTPSWHFAHCGSMLNVIPSTPDCGHYIVDVGSRSYKLHQSKRSKLFFSAVLRAGQHVVALGDTLQHVYILRSNLQWRRQDTTSCSIDLSQKVEISGFVDLVDDDAFIISDANTAECFLLDLKTGEWFAVGSSLGLLSGRCILVEGFIYSCTDEGLSLLLSLLIRIVCISWVRRSCWIFLGSTCGATEAICPLIQFARTKSMTVLCSAWSMDMSLRLLLQVMPLLPPQCK